MPRLLTVDFTRPTKFTADHERRLRRVLATFCRTSSTRLAAELRIPVELEVGEAEQLTWSHAHDRLEPTALCAVVKLTPADTRMLMSVDLAFALTAIESLLGGPPDAPPPERRLSEIDLALAEHVFENLLAQLSVVWRDLAGVELELAGVDSVMETAQVAPVSEPTLCLEIDARMLGAAYTITLLVPHAAIAPVEDQVLGRGASSQVAASPAVHRQLQGALAGVDVALCAEIAGSDMAARDLLALAPGDTLPLGVPVAAGLDLCVEGMPVLRGTPGRRGVRRAVQVTKTLTPDSGEPVARPREGGGRRAVVAPGQPDSGLDRSTVRSAIVAEGQPDSGLDRSTVRSAIVAEGQPDGGLDRSLGAVPVAVWAELGRARMHAAAVVDLPPGAVVELDRRVDDPIRLFVNGLPFATGGLVVAEGAEWAVRIDALAGPESGD